jgi:acyl-CoA thioester hydrolase
MLQTEKLIAVRFCEVDSMHIVWHGNYVKYLEEGREDFGRRYGLGYLTLAAAGYGIPIVELELSYKKSLRYGDSIIVETRYVASSANKICFNYRILNATTRQLVCTGRSTQVFIDSHQQLQLLPPPCFTEWQQKWLPSPQPAA